MSWRRVRVTQSVADTDAFVPLPIPLSKDTAVDFTAFMFTWADYYLAIPSADVIFKATVQLVETDTSPNDPEAIFSHYIQIPASAGFIIADEPHLHVLPEPVRVVHKTWVRLETANTGAANDLHVVAWFKETKISPTAYARLLMRKQVYQIENRDTVIERPRRRTLRRGTFTGTFRGSFVG